jgi:hypothetical protein
MQNKTNGWRRRNRAQARRTLGRALERLGDVDAVDDVGLDAVAAALDLRGRGGEWWSSERARRRGSERAVASGAGGGGWAAAHPSGQLGHLVAVEAVAGILGADVDGRHGAGARARARGKFRSGRCGAGSSHTHTRAPRVALRRRRTPRRRWCCNQKRPRSLRAYTHKRRVERAGARLWGWGAHKEHGENDGALWEVAAAGQGDPAPPQVEGATNCQSRSPLQTLD